MLVSRRNLRRLGAVDLPPEVELGPGLDEQPNRPQLDPEDPYASSMFRFCWPIHRARSCSLAGARQADVTPLRPRRIDLPAGGTVPSPTLAQPALSAVPEDAAEPVEAGDAELSDSEHSAFSAEGDLDVDAAGLMPRLSKPGMYCMPSLDELAGMSAKQVRQSTRPSHVMDSSSTFDSWPG